MTRNTILPLIIEATLLNIISTMEILVVIVVVVIVVIVPTIDISEEGIHGIKTTDLSVNL